MSTGWKRFWTILLGALFVLGFIGFVAGLVVRRDLLDPALYTSALEENNVYERIYVDVFGDPALQDALAESLGIESNLIAGETYAELVAVFNIILPPPRMQNVTERFFVELTDYLSGETAELEPQLPLGDTVDADVLAEHITDAIVTVSIEAGSLALPRVAPVAIPLVEAQLLAYLEDVTAGIFAPVPIELLTASSDHLTPDEQDGLVNNMLGPVADKTSTLVKRQIRASLAANDVVGALAMAMRERLRDRAQLAAANLETTLAESDALNAVAQTANALDSTGESVIAGLNTVRGLCNNRRQLAPAPGDHPDLTSGADCLDQQRRLEGDVARRRLDIDRRGRLRAAALAGSGFLATRDDPGCTQCLNLPAGWP